MRDDALAALAVSHATLSPWRLLTAMFLHASWEHILGNMLFLWIFGAALEGRLGHIRYLIVYLICGMTGGLLSDIVTFRSATRTSPTSARPAPSSAWRARTSTCSRTR